jgi:hypothetical protein
MLIVLVTYSMPLKPNQASPDDSWLMVSRRMKLLQLKQILRKKLSLREN